MNASNDIHAIGCEREKLLREEQRFCRQAIESRVYDSMSDREWIAECEHAVAKVRRPRKNAAGSGI